MCVTAEEEELALRWLVIGECLLAPQNRRSSFSGPGWTLRSLSAGPCCVTTHHLCSLAVPPSPNRSAILLLTDLKKQQPHCLRYASDTIPLICLSGAAVRRVRWKERAEESEQESAAVLCRSCLRALRRSAGTFTQVTRREGSSQHNTAAARSLSMAPKGSAQNLQRWAELYISHKIRNHTYFIF